MTFRLFTEDAHWWTLADYGAVLGVVEKLRPRTAIEFGPGSSTLALIEGGVRKIDACEDNPVYLERHRVGLAARFPDAIRLVHYAWADPLRIPQTDSLRYDLALIDGPADCALRGIVLAYCLERCAHVLIPTEDTPTRSLRRTIELLARTAKRPPVTYIESGALAGAFALIEPPC